MSDKDRRKKDHKRTDKKNKALKESENPHKQEASPRHQAKDESNLTDGGQGRNRTADAGLFRAAYRIAEVV
jgi:hypothetical protein